MNKNVLNDSLNLWIFSLYVIVVGLSIFSLIVTVFIDTPQIGGEAFTLMHHYPETVGFTVFFFATGAGAYWQNAKKMRTFIRAGGFLLLGFYGALSALQTAGVYMGGFPMFMFLFIAIAYACGLGVGVYYDSSNLGKENKGGDNGSR